jgi:hypothetical protein
VSELFTQGSVGGAAGNCCLYPASRPVEQGLLSQGLVSLEGYSRAADWERWALSSKTGVV